MPRRQAAIDNTAAALSAVINRLADPYRAAVLRRFFRTGPGQYGHGDRFLGVPVPLIRKAARPFWSMPLKEVLRLLASPYHEHRFAALVILVRQFERGGHDVRSAIFKAYLDNTRFVNSWDLVDMSAPHIVGGYLADRDRRVLYRLARSKSLWERRIAMLATLFFIRRGDPAPALEMAAMLLRDPEDLIHKAAGWMLREAGKRDPHALCAFLDRHAADMPRTMLRYAVERLDAPRRRRYMNAGRGRRASAEADRAR